ncbi:capsid completion protein [Salmonella enterica subsp. enterica]|uniref:Capsid completion protein n=1 Tax=Salmonella enterica I TaxID=59201 RepID=A0A447N5P4_SALET|nr:capsid completion protein [Salmonella enterica subsp. enterica]
MRACAMPSKTGMAETNAELYDYRLRQTAAGFKHLADVPAEEIDGEECAYFPLSERRNGGWQPATLYERYRGVEATGKGDKKADSVETTIDDLWRDMRWSVARLQDKPRCIVGQL